MSAAKETRRARRLITALIQPLDGLSWFATASILLLAALALASYYLWQTYGQQILDRSQYRLTSDRIHVTAPPSWIRTDIKLQAVRLGSLDFAGIYEPDLTVRVAQAFGAHPWVRRVKRVTKHYPATVQVEVEYRQPVAMVVVTDPRHPGGPRGRLPVDIEGVVLPPEDFTLEDAEGYPRIEGVDTSPAAAAGSPWGDQRVAAAAKIAALLADHWQARNLHHIEVPPRRTPGAGGRLGDFLLVTRDGRRIPWGNPPGQEMAGEEPAARKIDRLRNLL